jgi:MFS transporter, DHA1 family, tetracycline resistance protein
MTARLLWLVFLTSLLNFMGGGIILPILPFYAKSMNASPEVIGVLVACFSVAQLCAAPALGRLSDVHGRRSLLLASLGGQAVAHATFAVATKLSLLPLLFVARIAAGLLAGNVVACQALVADAATGPERARGMGRMGMGAGLGLTVGPVVGGLLHSVDPTLPGLGAAALASAAFVMVLATLREERSGVRNIAPKGLPVRDGRVLRAMGLYFLTITTTAGLHVAATLMAAERLGWREKEVGRAFSVLGVVAILTQAGIGRVTRWVGERGAMLIGTTSITIAMALLVNAHTSGIALAALVLGTMGNGIMVAVVPSAAAGFVDGGGQGSVLGVVQSAGGLGRAFGPAWAGFIYGHFGAGAPFAVAAASGVVAFFLAFSLDMKQAGRPSSVTAFIASLLARGK